MSEILEVYLDLHTKTIKAGEAFIHRRRNIITTDFHYDANYLLNPHAYALDPALPLDMGGASLRGLPGAFSDCAPDRWGRRLITKRLRSEETGRTPRTLSDLDFLLGVSDFTRQGALRFRRRESTAFEDPSREIPKLVQLPALLRAADHIDSHDDSHFSAIKVLLQAGTGTLGGARPKASVMDDAGHLHIAKFPRHNDEWDVIAWEKTALDLAERAGIAVPPHRLTRVGGRPVLLVDRFDRRDGGRVGYQSAMTLLQASDGDDAHDYSIFAATLAEASEAPNDDLLELWRRIAFSALVNNTDDHLRNHGLLRGTRGWRLSPAFDVNPNPDTGEARVTTIRGASSRADELAALIQGAPEFGVSPEDARATLRQVQAATLAWRETATSNGVPKGELNRFEGAFEGIRDQAASLTS
jgi:serine/threonine-protein kinase HipA